MENLTIPHKRAALTPRRGENVWLRARIGRLSSELALGQAQQEKTGFYRQRLPYDTAKLDRFRGSLVSLRDSITCDRSLSCG